MVDLDTFLTATFAERPDDQHVLLARQSSLDGGFIHTPWPSDTLKRWMRGKVATYFTVSTVRQPEPDVDSSTYWRRRKPDCVEAYVLVLDDIGTKAAPPPVEPSYKLESSAGNFQWGYFIEPTADLERYAAIVEAVADLGFADKGAGGYNRVMRVPGSVNIKPGRDGFVSRITDWNPDNFWQLDDLAVKLGVDLNALCVNRTTVRSTVGGSQAQRGRVTDPMLEWLTDAGHVVDDNGTDFVSIKCPWGDQHTTGADTAGYSPLGRGVGGYADTRAFKCLHEHCREKKLADLVKWAAPNGGPEVQGFDPLPRLQSQYAVVIDGRMVADLWQRPVGGKWIYTLDEWGLLHHGTMRVPGRDTPVSIKTAMLESRGTQRASKLVYLPGEAAVCVENEQEVVNTYVEPQWAETHDEPTVFLDHIAYLLPDPVEQDLFINWLAFKIQNPAERSYAVLMVVPEKTQGIGRSWLGDILRRALGTAGGEKVNTVDLDKLMGKQTFNDYLFDCQFLIVEEARDVESGEFFHTYETLKERIDIQMRPMWRNTKYGAARNDRIWFNAMIFSNHSDALVIPEEDRRFCVLTNTSKRQTLEYYERLHSSGTNGEPARLYWYLKHRDVSGFDNVYAPMTQGKLRMLDQTRSPVEDIENDISEALPGDLVTLAQIRSMVRNAARKLGHSKVEQDPSGVARRLFKSFQRLREAKNGARYLIGTGQEEVRAVRNAAAWKIVDECRDKAAILAELAKNDSNVVSFPVVGVKG